MTIAGTVTRNHSGEFTVQNKEIAKVTIIVERDGKKTRYKKRFKQCEAMLGRIGDFMVKLQEDKPDEIQG
ncbi:hypothetical protein [Citrobacter phage CF1 DK-2017]|uniref:Uncharacterized protein n=1 Tax=Citrobacter phage CF1 DK-2017 TaxID=2267237 RepID=A0A1W6DXM7_9CAUD|nr:hypothetical protein HOR74_gp72 [Citrobacter phage CF1 DK-2017]ARK07668.1 hypothetical protein [Citrobacter phage CF1 DK-2017]